MSKLLQILLLLGLSISVFTNSKLDNFKISIPEFIPEGKSFEVMLTTSKTFESADQLSIYLITGTDLFLNGAGLWTKEGKTKLQVSSVFLNKFSTSAYNISIDLSSDNISKIEKYFQIALNFGPLSIQENNLKLYGEFKKDGKVIGYFENYDKNIADADDKLYTFPISTFEKYQIAVKNASLTPGSSLKIPLKYKLDGKLVIDFWVKNRSFGNSFLKLIDEQNKNIEFSLDLSEYQMLITNSGNHEQANLKPRFISVNAWYHINIMFSATEPLINFYCNDEEFSKVKLLYSLDIENLSLEFINTTIVSSINIEQFRLFDLYGSAKSILQNKNFKDFASDSSKLLFQLDFNNSELNSLKNSEKIFYTNLKLANSDAPIFPRAPEINLKVLNNFYEIEWTGGDYTNVSNYLLERAIGDNNFTEIAKQDADRNSEKIYTQLSEKTNQPEIVYFRVKQINLDKTEVFSDVVKVGQGVIKDIILEQNYPNPFNPKTQIEFELVQDSDVDVVVYNLAGKEVALLHKGFLSKGKYNFEFDGSDLPSGIYLFQVVSSQSTQTRKMILAK
jgi:hypothetical protein